MKFSTKAMWATGFIFLMILCLAFLVSCSSPSEDPAEFQDSDSVDDDDTSSDDDSQGDDDIDGDPQGGPLLSKRS